LKSLIVTEKFNNKKLSAFLLSSFPKLSINSIYKALRKRDIKINGTRTSQDLFVHTADNIDVYITDDILDKNGISAESVDYLILHQANQRIIKAVQDRLGYDDDKVISNIECLGNTSASSILIAMGEAIKNNKIKTPAKAIICGFGAGMCWGAGVINLRDGIFKQENIYQK